MATVKKLTLESDAAVKFLTLFAGQPRFLRVSHDNRIGDWHAYDLAVVDLNRVFANSALASGSVIAGTTLSTSRQANASPYASFSDAFASAQASVPNSQDGISSTDLTQPFQSQGLWESFIFSGQSNSNSGNSNAGASEDFSSEKSATTKAASDSNKDPEDVYVGSGATDRSHDRTDRKGTRSEVDNSGQQPNCTQQTEKIKPYKGLRQAGRETPDIVNSSSNTTLPSDEGVASSGQAGADAGESNPAALGLQSNSTGPAITNIVRKPKVNDSNSDLAFAIKVQGDGPSTSPIDGPINTGLTSEDLNAPTSRSPFDTPITTLMSSPGPKNSGSPANGNNSALGLTQPVVSGSQKSQEASDTVPAETAQEDVSNVEEAPEVKVPNSQPLKTVQVQITGAENQRVDLTLMEKSGALTMSVRSADGNLTKALQQNLPELTTKLNDQQVRAEWWKPGAQDTDTSQKLFHDSLSGNGNQPAAQDRRGQDQGNPGRQGGRGTPQTDWVEELSNLRKSTQNGIQYSWHL